MWAKTADKGKVLLLLIRVVILFSEFFFFQECSLVAQMVKHLSAMRETWVRFLGWEDLLEREMATHSSVLAHGIPGMGEPGGLPSMGSHRVRHN